MTSQTITNQTMSGLRPGYAVISSRTTPAGFPTAPSCRPASPTLLLAMGTGNTSTGNTSSGNTSTGNASTGNASTGNASTGNASTGSVTPMADAVGGKPPRPREARPV
jgi:hypothetical protein